MQARGIFASGAVVILAVSATVILFLHPKHGSSLDAFPSVTSPFDAAPTSFVASTPPPAVDPCAGKLPWLSGPANERFEDHLAPTDVRTGVRASDVAMDRTLNVMFSHRATVGQANAALCEADVDVVSILLKQRILMVHVPGGPEDVHAARGKLIAHRFIEAVAPASMTSIQDGLAFKAESARLGVAKGFNRCDWASGQLAKKLGIAKPLYCHQSERREIDGREVLFTAVHADDDCSVVAVVDDDGVFPFATRCKPSSPFAKLAQTELTGEKHSSIGTDVGKKAVDAVIYRVENAPIPRAENK